MAADSKEVLASKQEKWQRVIILNYGMPHQKFGTSALEKKYRDQGIDTSIVEIFPATNQLAQPLPFKIGEKTKVIVVAHGSRNSSTMTADTGESMTATNLAEIIAANMERNVTRLQINLGLCNGGIGESASSHEASFAGHLVHALSQCGIEDPVVSARLGLASITNRGRGQVQFQENTDENPFSPRSCYFDYATQKNQERYNEIYCYNYVLRPRAGKLAGSKVILRRNKEKQLIPTYPYGEAKSLGLESAPASIRKLHEDYILQYRKIREQAKEVYENILLSTLRSNPADIETLLKYPGFIEMFFDMLLRAKKNFMLDAETLVTVTSIEIDRVRNYIKEADYPVVDRFKEELKDKINKARKLRFYLNYLEHLKANTIEAMGEMEDHLFTIDKKRKTLECIESAATIYPYDTELLDKLSLSSLMSFDVERFKYHSRRFLARLSYDDSLLDKLSAVISMEDAIKFAVECKNECPQILEMLKEDEFVSVEDFGRLFITRHNRPIRLEDLEALSVKEQIEIAQLVGKEEQGFPLDAREEGLKNAYVSLAKLNGYKKAIRDLFSKKRSPSLEFFSATEEMPAQIVNILAAKDLSEILELGSLFLKADTQMTEDTEFRFRMLIQALRLQSPAEDQAISMVPPNPEENKSGPSSMTPSC